MQIKSLIPVLALLIGTALAAPVELNERAEGDHSYGSCRFKGGDRPARPDRTRTRTAVNAGPTTPSVEVPTATSSTIESASASSEVVPVPSPTSEVEDAPEVTSTTEAEVEPTPSPSPSPAPAPSPSPSPSPAPPSSDGGAPNTDAGAQLQLHNDFRRQYGAEPLTWSSELADFAQQVASSCVFEHSGGPYGENLAAGSGGSYNGESGFRAWANEADQYDWNNPGFASGTGHFTQVVWKATTELGCAIAECPSGTIFGQASKYLVCEYRKPGNVVGNGGQYFRDNVGTLQG